MIQDFDFTTRGLIYALRGQKAQWVPFSKIRNVARHFKPQDQEILWSYVANFDPHTQCVLITQQEDMCVKMGIVNAVASETIRKFQF